MFNKLFLVCIGLMVITSSRAQASSKIELDAVIQQFLIPASAQAVQYAEYNTISWSAGAESNSPQEIRWKTVGIKNIGSNNYTRHADAVIAFDGKTLEMLTTRVEPLDWHIDLYGSHALPTLITIDSGLVSSSPIHVRSYLKRHGYHLILKECYSTNSSGGAYAALYKLEKPKFMPVNFVIDVSCGIRCSQRYDIGYVGYHHLSDFNVNTLDSKSLDRCKNTGLL